MDMNVALDGATLSAVLGAYPGAGLRLTPSLAVAEANAAGEELLEGDPRWLPGLKAWLGANRVAPGLNSLPAVMPRGAMIVEWAAVPLPDGGFLLFGRDVSLERQLRHALTESRQRYKDLVEISSDFAWETGPDGRFVFVTPRGALGYDADALIGRHPSELVPPEWGDLPLPFDTRRDIDQTELWLRGADDSLSCVVASAVPLHDPGGAWKGARGVCRDVTEQVLRANELARVRNRERLLAHIVHTLRTRLDASESLSMAAAETARALGADGCIIFQASDGGALHPVADFAASQPDAPTPAMLTALLDGPGEEPVPGACPGWRLLASRTEYQDGLNGAVAVWRGEDAEPFDEEDLHLMAGVADHIGIAHAQIANQERLRRLSERDGLTGLFNRRTFFERLDEQLGRPEAGPSALLYVDLDNFKAVNDQHGHQAGDAVLRAVGSLLTNGVRPGDLPGRLGGDEFVLWLGRADEERACAVAERLLTGIAELADLSASPDKPLGLSIGIAVHRPGRGESVRELTDRADAAMYIAKGRGKGNFALASDFITPAETTP